MLRKILHLLNLDSELEDFDTIHETIEKDSIFRGTNLWILVFAIVVASVGLNINSTAVIIGAMLISPLMGPINGMGYSIATYNFPLFRRAVKNFTFAVLASLLASTTYFAISPVSTAHSELLARTSPTIYDVMIALFGGLAGIVAISSKKKGNVIPGVAIATALMPPLCTAGYGLATAQLNFFFGAIYLFTINTVFIAISSVAFSQIFKFPIRTVVDDQKKKKVARLVSVIITIILIPSIYFGYQLVQKEKFIENANNFTKDVSFIEGNYLMKSEVNADEKSITLIYAGNTITSKEKILIKQKTKNFNLENAEVIIEQGFSYSDIKTEMSEKEHLKSEIGRLKQLLDEKDRQRDSVSKRVFIGKELLNELQTIFPEISTCSFAEAGLFHDTLIYPLQTKIVSLSSEKDFTIDEKQKIISWLKARLKTENMKLLFEKEEKKE
ncbi:MAG: DUF389 domain-containing protein [bacterium]